MFNHTYFGSRRLIAVTVCALVLGMMYAVSGGGHARAQDSTPTATATSTTSSDTVTAATTGDFSVGDTVFVADGPLNVRSEATINGTKKDSLPTGTSMTITDGPVAADGHNWWEIDTGDITGWVAGEFLSADNPGGFGVGDNVVVFDGPLNVRAPPR